MSPNNFKVILVGGGPVGLTAAHALMHANIDFVMLEQRSEIIIDAGTDLVLSPVGLRVLGHLGLSDQLSSVSSPLSVLSRIDHQGRDMGDMHWFLHFKEYFGAASTVLSRHDLTRVLYESLPASTRAKLHPNKKVSDIGIASNGVRVICTDGTSYEGSIIIGADGAHSRVRGCMHNLSLEDSSTGKIEQDPFLTTWRAFWMRFPRPDDMEPGTTIETHGKSASTQLFAGETTTVVGLYERLEKPTRDRIRFTESDEAAIVRRWSNLPLRQGGKLTLGEAYGARVHSGVVSLEEGVLKQWSWDGRIVLVGDAAHKFTPSTGQGCNNGILDVVVLVNELHKVLEEARASPDNSEVILGKGRLAVAFKNYQDSRYDDVVAACKGSNQSTATSTWESGIHKFLDQYVLSSHRLQRFLTSRAASTIAQAPVFEFLDGQEQMVGKVPWATPIGYRLMKV